MHVQLRRDAGMKKVQKLCLFLTVFPRTEPETERGKLFLQIVLSTNPCLCSLAGGLGTG